MEEYNQQAQPESNQPSQQPCSPQTPPQVPCDEKARKDENMWAMLCHLSALAGLTSIPFANVLGPLIVWLIKRDEYPLVESNGKESLNFQITISIAIIISIPLIFLFGLGALLIFGLGIYSLIMVIIGSVTTSNGEEFTYPWSIKFFK